MGTHIVYGRTSEGFDGPTAETLGHLAKGLQTWRKLLPPKLQWPEDDSTTYPNVVHEDLKYQPNIDPALADKLFSIPSQQIQPSALPYVYDVQVALLRTRYYYAKYMVYRPFVYKALHFPKQITSDDADAVGICLKVC